MTSRDEAGTDPEQLPDNLEDLASRSERPAPFVERIDTQSFAGGIPQNQARLPQIRIGTHWISPAWPLIGLTIVGLLVAVAIAKQLRMYPWMQDFIATYPGWRISTGSPMGPFQIYDVVGMMTPYMLNKDSDDPGEWAFAERIKTEFIDNGYLGRVSHS